MPKKGRPTHSQIRQNIIEILYRMGRAYGYRISKIYLQAYPPVTRRVIYYHLRKGLEIGEFEIDRIEKEIGDFSWGSISEKTYYKLGKNAKPRGDYHPQEIK